MVKADGALIQQPDGVGVGWALAALRVTNLHLVQSLALRNICAEGERQGTKIQTNGLKLQSRGGSSGKAGRFLFYYLFGKNQKRQL